MTRKTLAAVALISALLVAGSTAFAGEIYQEIGEQPLPNNGYTSYKDWAPSPSHDNAGLDGQYDRYTDRNRRQRHRSVDDIDLADIGRDDIDDPSNDLGRNYQAGDNCVTKHKIRQSLREQGWRNLNRARMRRHLVRLNATRPNGFRYRLRIDRCTGVILNARLLNPPSSPYVRGRRNYVMDY